jgi:hypothetical protein
VLALLIVLALPIEVLLESHGFGRPQRDTRLDEAAEALAARVALDEGEVAAGQLRFLLDKYGVADARVVPLSGFEAPVPAVLARLDRRFPPTHYGMGTADRGGHLLTTVLLVHRGAVLTDTVPLAVKVSEIRQLRGQLRPGYSRPRLLVAPPGQPVREQPAAGAGRGIDAVVAFDGPTGMWGVELVADSEHGPVVLTNQRVYVGETPPDLPRVNLSPGPTTMAPEPVLVAWINQLRSDHRLGTLQVDPRLAAVAQAHAEDLERQGALVHLTPETGTLTTRLKAQQIRVLASAENLARADDVRAAMRAFLQSPGHLRNLLLPELSHVGVGVKGRYFAVVLVRL